jgi:hypothetical protein
MLFERDKNYIPVYFVEKNSRLEISTFDYFLNGRKDNCIIVSQ